MSAHVGTGTSTQDGWALPVVMMIIAFVTLLSIGGFALSSQALRESSVVQSESAAFQAANAGIDEAMARLPRGQTGTYTVEASQLGTGTTAVVNVNRMSAYTYRITSTGYAPGGFTERVMTEFTRLDLYDMNISAGSGGDMISTGAVKGNSSVYGPYYTGGSIDTGRFYNGPIYVAGNVTGGTFTNIDDAYYGTTPGELTGHVTNLHSGVPKMPPLPTLQDLMQGYLDLAKTQSVDNKMGDTSSAVAEATPTGQAGTYGYTSYATLKGLPAASYPYYKYVGMGGTPTTNGSPNAVTIDTSTGSFGKYPATPSASSTDYDDFAWDKTNKILYVNGTVFIDGDFTLDMEDLATRYIGNGTIVCSGRIHITADKFGPYSGMQPGIVDGATVANQNFPANQCLGFVSPTEIHLAGSNSNSTKTLSDAPEIAGAFYCPAVVRFDKNILVAGSVITNLMLNADPKGNNNVHFRNSPNLKDVAPESMPGRNDGLMGYTKWIRQ